MIHFECPACQRRYGPEPIWRCHCGHYLDIELEPRFPLEAIKKRGWDLWRYAEALPETGSRVSLGEGCTPVVSRDFNGVRVLVKLEYLFPTGSFKDRGAAMLLSVAKSLGLDRVVVDSSGNAAAAVAAYSAAAGIACEVFVPWTTSPEKLAQIEAYGADLVKVKGTREDTALAALEAARETYYASHYWNPCFLQGTKTFAYEVWEQMDGEVPDAVLLPAGHGTLLLGAYLGFTDLVQAGSIGRCPRLIAVQARSCAPLARAWEKGSTELPPIEPRETVAEGIAIQRPLRWRQMIDAVQSTGGTILTVFDDEIVASHRRWARQGFFIEPTSAAVTAALEKCLIQGIVKEGETVVLPLTGSGLKSGRKAAPA